MILLGMWAAWRIVHSPFGRVLVAIRDNPARARALGYDVERYKMMVFVLSAGLAGLAGGVFSISHGFASLQELDWTTSGKVVLMTVLGGIGTLWGGPVGAALVVMLEDRLASSGFEGVGIITGGIFIICVLLFRRGIWGTARDLLLWARIKFAPGRKTAAPDEDATRWRPGPRVNNQPGARAPSGGRAASGGRAWTLRSLSKGRDPWIVPGPVISTGSITGNRWSPFCAQPIVIGVPSGNSPASSVMSGLDRRMHPWLAAVPMLAASSVPCSPIWPGPPPKLLSASENADSPNA